MSQPIKRQIRVFVSSTFRDMQLERDHLVKIIFPQLRKLCEQRDVIWSEVDLRWGITDEQSAEGQVLPICLEQIQRCKPYFIGLLGERYGWIPDTISQELIEREPWLKGHLQHSVTELEILHGVLNNPEMAGHALFYFRDPEYIKILDPIHLQNFIEVPWREDIERYGLDEAQKRVGERNLKLKALKKRIRESELLPLRENYRDYHQLGEWVLKDFTLIINHFFPEGSQPDSLQREALEHAAFASSRARIYIGGTQYFSQLNMYASRGGKPLAVLGESGSGKSALLANWAIQYQAEHPKELVLIHFIGATTSSVDWAAMLRRILAELQKHFNLPGEIPDEPEKLRSEFPNWLHMASIKGKVVLILDALNQLEDRQGAQELTWLPTQIPENIRLIISMLPGKSLQAIRERNLPTLTIQLLIPEEREQLVVAYLAQYSKQLSSTQIKRIVAGSLSSNPLGLRLLVEELRQYGLYENLDEMIDHYLEAKTISELFDLILQRCEVDFEEQRPGLVKDALSYLWAGRRGLSEAELLDLLGSDGQPLPQYIWSPLYLALEQSFLDRRGMLGFFHDYIRQAVEDKYLAARDAKTNVHTILADYFERADDNSPRKVDELPWQLAQAQNWQRLYDLLAHLDFFQKLCEQSRYDLLAYWAAIESETGLKRITAYRQVADHPDRFDLHLLNWLGHLFNDAGYLHEAMELHKQQERICRQLTDPDGLQNALGNQALILHAWGKLEEAMALYKEQERICLQLDNLDGLQRSLGNQANVLYARGKLEEAMSLFKKKEHICRQLGNQDGFRRSLGNQANILYAWHKLDQAMALHKQEEQICRQLGDLGGLRYSLGNQALILYDRGDLDGAVALHKEEERICRALGDLAGLQSSLGNQSNSFTDWGRLEEAMMMLKEQESICRHLGDLPNLSFSLGNQALILNDWGRLEEAMTLLKEKEGICRQISDQDGLQTTLAIQALIMQNLDKLDEAMTLYKEEELLCRQQDNIIALCMSLVNQGGVFEKLGDRKAQIKLVAEAFTLARQNGYKDLAKQIEGIYKDIAK